MDTPLKELAKLEKLQAFPSPLSTSSKATSKSTPSVSETLDSLLNSLQELKQRVEAGTISEVDVQEAAKLVEEKKKELDERQKEIHGSLGKLGKAIDKVTPASCPACLTTHLRRNSPARYCHSLPHSRHKNLYPLSRGPLQTTSYAQVNSVSRTYFVRYVFSQ